MDGLAVVLRIVHIICGVLWVGGAALFFFYLEPTMNKLGPDAEKFVDEMINRRKAPIYFVATSTLAVLAGVVLYWRDFGGISTSTFGLALGFGGLTGLIAWLGGNLLIPRALGKLGPSLVRRGLRAALHLKSSWPACTQLNSACGR